MDNQKDTKVTDNTPMSAQSPDQADSADDLAPLTNTTEGNIVNDLLLECQMELALDFFKRAAEENESDAAITESNGVNTEATAVTENVDNEDAANPTQDVMGEQPSAENSKDADQVVGNAVSDTSNAEEAKEKAKIIKMLETFPQGPGCGTARSKWIIKWEKVVNKTRDVEKEIVRVVLWSAHDSAQWDFTETEAWLVKTDDGSMGRKVWILNGSLMLDKLLELYPQEKQYFHTRLGFRGVKIRLIKTYGECWDHQRQRMWHVPNVGATPASSVSTLLRE
ncbi:hypothetical protein QBC34DRAFT_428547 [Podospora aff. communis PSN243]|uniref:Uncharacterized protein n=1 Tax=Podospora aff. communis PSN243 TaxID=3040156 RepID=A0AAV9GFI9_9PEZI|nr:hypothetical protein QBC34DRAFT_428547 [Podospora aff. communis PSN243]